jgi:hypothetical protein
VLLKTRRTRRPFFELEQTHPTSEELEDLKKPAYQKVVVMLQKVNLRGEW